jgi:glycosyltransferase involved in cell wall biosynthesis
MINITHVITDSNVGGAGILLSSLLSEIDKSPFSFRVILPRNSLLLPLLSFSGATVIEADITPDCSLAIGDFFTFYELLGKHPTQILHTHGSLCARLAGKARKIPVCMLTRHCDTRQKVPSFVYNATTDFTVATSLPLYEHLLSYGVKKKKLCFIKNGVAQMPKASEERKIELKKALSIPERHKVITTIGRLEKIKGHEIFLYAAKKVLAEFPSATFLIVGDGGEKEKLLALADTLGLSTRVRFCGYSDKVFEYLSISDVFVNSSIGSETSSLAISEASSLCLPVVCSDIEGNRDMVENEKSGLLFKSESPSSLAEKMLLLLYDDTLCHALGARAKEKYENELSLSLMAEKYKDLYLSLSKRL